MAGSFWYFYSPPHKEGRGRTVPYNLGIRFPNCKNCRMIKRSAATELQNLARSFKAVALLGPRQSGKTTLSKAIFPGKPYVSLEAPDSRAFAIDDPRGFLAQFPSGAILGEVQRTPQLFSYLQQILDETAEPGAFILTGSNNFLLQESLSQSLAGRVGFLFLLPFNADELNAAGQLAETVDTYLLKGSYPPVYDQPVTPQKWYPNYIRTYIERDVRQLRNITNLGTFERFLRLCAGRTGQLLNLNSLGIEAGADHKTIASWISVLESSFVIYLLRPHHQNFNKRVVKTPKLYFTDTGLACSLLGIRDESQLALHPLRGGLFENMVVTEVLKQRLNSGQEPQLYFWRDNTGHEIDLLLDRGTRLVPLEIKSGQTITPDYFASLTFWQQLTGTAGGTVVYGGRQAQSRSNGITVLPWQEVAMFAAARSSL